MISEYRAMPNKNNVQNGKLRTSDVLLFVYLCALFAHRTGIGLDYYLLRGSFVLYAIVSFFLDVLPAETGRRKGKENGKLISRLLVWFSVFVFFVYLSVFWSESLSNTMATNYITNFFQGFFIVAFISYRVQKRDDLLLVIKIVVCAAFYGVVVLFLKTPLSSWGTERVGDAIGLNSNTVGLNAAFATMFCLFLSNNTKRPLYYLFTVVFIVVALFSGSRKALFLVLAGIVLILSFSHKGFKGLAAAISSIIIVAIIIWAIMNVPALYDVLGYRVDKLLGNAGYDGSAAEREWYRSYAQDMFLNSSIVGYGFNGFLSEMQRIGYWHQAYCHCNQWELLADLGIIGFTLYYSIFIMIGKGFINKIKMNGANSLFGLIMLLLIFVSDYGYVSFMGVDIYLYITLLFCLEKTLVSKWEEPCLK